MPHIVRKITSKRRFDKPSPEYPWIAAGDVQADAVTDLRTSSNCLSIYLVHEQEEAVDRVIAALAATRDRFDALDYVVLDIEDFIEFQQEFQIRLDNTPGNTPDDTVNTWHRNLIELTDRKVVELAKAFVFHGQKIRKLRPQIKALVEQGVVNETLLKSRMNPKLLSRVKKELSV